MSKYMIEAIVNDTTVYYTLDATSEITKTLTGSATAFPLEDGTEVSDNYVNKNTTISSSGIVSDIKSQTASQHTLKTAEYINGLELLKSSKKTFTFFMMGQKDSNTGADFSVIRNCVFESLSITQDKQNGGKLGGPQSYKISFTLKQIRFVKRAVQRSARAKAIINKTEPAQTMSAPTTTSNKQMYINNDGNRLISKAQYDALEDREQAVVDWTPTTLESLPTRERLTNRRTNVRDLR